MAWPLRVAGVQPPTALIFSIWCDEEKQVYISAPFAVLVLKGVSRSGLQLPATTMWFNMRRWHSSTTRMRTVTATLPRHADNSATFY